MKRHVVRRNEQALQRTDWGGTRGLFSGAALVPASPFSFGLISYRKPHHSGRHDDNELIYVLRGRGTARVGGDRVPLKAGTLLVVPRGTDHGIEQVRGGVMSAVVVHFA